MRVAPMRAREKFSCCDDGARRERILSRVPLAQGMSGEVIVRASFPGVIVRERDDPVSTASFAGCPAFAGHDIGCELNAGATNPAQKRWSVARGLSAFINLLRHGP
jgi:hypothetical protein